MLTIAKENTIIFNDEYIKYQPLIDTVQRRLENDIDLFGYDLADRQDALEYAHDRVSLFRMLKDTEFSEDETVRRLLDTIEWRKEQKVARMTYESVTPEFFGHGFAFFHKQDRLGRPIAVIQMRHFPTFLDKTKSLSDFMVPFAMLVLEIARQITRDKTRENEAQGHSPVLVSQIAIVLDIAKAPFVPVDSSLMYSLKDIVNSRFPGFVGSVYIMNFGWMYQGIWQVAKLVLSEQAKARVSFTTAKEMTQVIEPEHLLKVLGGLDEYEWSFESDTILNQYATDKRFEVIQTRPSRSSSVSSFSSVFYDAPDFISSPSTPYPILQSTLTSTSPSLYGTPGTLTPINAHRHQVALRSPSPEPRYFLNGFHLGDSFLTSVFRTSRPSVAMHSLDSQELTHRLNELVLSEEEQVSSTIHFPHMLPTDHPQSIYLASPVKHQLVRMEQKLIRLTRRLFHLSFAYKGAVYWILMYILLRGPVEHSLKKTITRLLSMLHPSAGFTQEQITYTTIGATATIAAAFSTSFSHSLHHHHQQQQHHSKRRL
ncbi:CRAL-TRIO domain-containing protein [Blakeslea trispora]|nr:CRAL-TRIO domain-containing protein [Blakeslea trispora]